MGQFYKARKKTIGFTLVELSIVIIIIGILISGISAGSSLIKQAQLNSVINETTDYGRAWRQFISIYGYIPGDFPNAYDYWHNINGVTCTNTDVNADPNGCNGNGDQIMGPWTREGVRAWQHLSLANLISGHYTGERDAGGALQIGLNAPGSKFLNAGYHFIIYTNSQTTLDIGGAKDNDRLVTNIFTSQEAYLIDQKMDDALANSGRIVSNWGYTAHDSGDWGNHCSDGGVNYLLNTAGIICRLSWVQDNSF